MPTLRAITWNAYGGNTTNLATAIGSLNIDITVIQEARNNINAAFYTPSII